ncbi:transposase-like protein [Clostridium sardiniense]|nr:transposase-like protein [Clostridium sardiniense]
MILKIIEMEHQVKLLEVIPRHRNSNCTPVSVKKYIKNYNEFDQKIIGLYIEKEKRDYKYALVIDSYYSNFDKLSTFFAFSKTIRKMIHATNTLEVFNRQLPKCTKIRTVLPTDESLRKSLYLATDQIMKNELRQ